MACRTPSVDRVAGKFTETLKGKLAALEKQLKDDDDARKKDFFARINEGLSDAKITDARQIGYNSAIKTEMTSEFNLDAIGKIINNALDTAIAVLNDPKDDESVKALAAGVTNPMLTPAALESYKGIVTAVMGAARSSSEAAGSISFSMNRLSEGVYAFLYASSVNLADHETFGDETITVTTVYYRIMQSIQDVKMQGAFDAILLAKSAYVGMVANQAALVKKLSLAQPDFTVSDWMSVDAQFSKAVAQSKATMDAIQFGANGPSKGVLLAQNLNVKSNQDVAHDAVKKLVNMGDSHVYAVEKTKQRLANAYF